MRTPKEYTDNLTKGIITTQMLLDALYSVNKRAKNWRDKEREYRSFSSLQHSINHFYYDKYNNIEKAKATKEAYYKQKEMLLSIIKPVCIHKELVGYERERIYDYDPRYKNFAMAKNFVWENCYYDHDEERKVWFGDVELRDKPRYFFYLFYDLGGNHTFHSPIKEEKIDQLELPIVEIGSLNTKGNDISFLLSTQFVKKMLVLIASGKYKLSEIAEKSE